MGQLGHDEQSDYEEFLYFVQFLCNHSFQTGGIYFVPFILNNLFSVHVTNVSPTFKLISI